MATPQCYSGDQLVLGVNGLPRKELATTERKKALGLPELLAMSRPQRTAAIAAMTPLERATILEVMTQRHRGVAYSAMTSDERTATWEAMTQAQQTAMKESLDDRNREKERLKRKFLNDKEISRKRNKDADAS